MILFTNKYAVTHENGIFKIVITKHEDDIVYGYIIYHTANSEKSTDVVETKLETLVGTDEEKILDDCIDWLHKNVPGETEVALLFE